MFNSKFNLIFLYCAVVFLEIIKTSRTGATQERILKFFNSQDPKIINGTVASLNATRHQVSIRKRKNDGYFFGTGHICGGSLISENVVLSAAHCFVNYDILEPSGTFYPDDYFIAVMGNLNRFENNNNTLVFDFKKIVKRVEIFDLSSFDEDIVLIFLEGKVPAQHPTVKPIVLYDGALKNNTMCQATGWGFNEEDYSPDILMTVDLPIIDYDDCREKTVYGDVVHEGMLCAGYLEGEKDACKGDSGGPLVCRGLQAGIVSWGAGCAIAYSPGVYTNVSYYKTWILAEVTNHNGSLPKFSGREEATGRGDGDNGSDGVADLRCSLILINLILIFNSFVC